MSSGIAIYSKRQHPIHPNTREELRNKREELRDKIAKQQEELRDKIAKQQEELRDKIAKQREELRNKIAKRREKLRNKIEKQLSEDHKLYVMHKKHLVTTIAEQSEHEILFNTPIEQTQSSINRVFTACTRIGAFIKSILGFGQPNERIPSFPEFQKHIRDPSYREKMHGRYKNSLLQSHTLLT